MDVAKCHAFCVKQRHMSPSATVAMQSGAASPATNPAQARHQSQPSPLSATLAMQNEGGCHEAPRLPRDTKVDVTKCHAVHVQRREVPRLPRETKAQALVCQKWRATKAVCERRQRVSNRDEKNTKRRENKRDPMRSNY